ncbi:MAG: alpha/beta fold hydrolase, partial [Cyanobacteria bacterium J06636_16]
MQNSHLRRFLGTIFGSLAIAVTALPSLAAEQVIFSYGLIEVAISVDALATFAREGQLTDELAFYLQDTTSEERQELQAFLLTPVELGHVTVSQFLYSSLGEVLLQYLGDLVQTDSGLNGFHALRSAVVLAAADAEGLTILNVLQQFPTQTVRVNGPRVVQIAGATAQLLEQTEQMLALIEQQAALEIETATAVDFTQYRDLEQPGTLEWQVETLRAYDQTRDRTIEADLYQPQAASSERVPVVVISHGLGSDRRSFVDLAQHLASYGFGVVLLDHPGVNSQQIQKLFSGMANEVVDPREFIEAPKDVSFLLDELERLAQTSPQSVRLDLQQVGMMGHSFGGYIAFALAGAEFDLEGLQADCAADADGLNLVNFSLLLQCTLLELEEDAFLSLQDERTDCGLVWASRSS